MLLDIIRLYTDFNIPIAPGRHKHSRRGWVNTICPFHEGSAGGYHLGYNLTRGYFFCYGCGWHPTHDTIRFLTHTHSSFGDVKKLIQKYAIEQAAIPEEIERETPQAIKWPDGCATMTDRHKAYLSGRGFDPDKLEREWGLKGTDNWGPYSFRIVAPITFEGQVVSWQTRDITNKQAAKYLPCPEELEIIHHKHLLYGLDKAVWDTVVVVEGITGVWRLGPGSVATFGAEFTASQIFLISKRFKSVLLLFDGDEAGQLATERMDISLRALGCETEILEPIGCDSGDMPDGLAEKIMTEVRR